MRAIVAGRLVATMTAVKSCTITPKLTVMSEGYLGETTDRKDDMFHGCGIELEVHIEDQEALTIVQLIIDRASRRTAQASSHIDVVTTLFLANGQRPRITVPDIKFSDMPLTIAQRDAYIPLRLSGESDTFRLSNL